MEALNSQRTELTNTKLALQIRMQNCSFMAASERVRAWELDAAAAAQEQAAVRFAMLRTCVRLKAQAEALDRMAAGYGAQIVEIEDQLAELDAPVPMAIAPGSVRLTAEQALAMDETAGAV